MPFDPDAPYEPASEASPKKSADTGFDPSQPYELAPAKPPASERFSMGRAIGNAVSSGLKTAAGDLVSPAEDAWKSLKADYQRAFPPKGTPVPEGMWDRAKYDFDRLVGLEKLPIDAFSVAVSPITGLLNAGVARPISTATGGILKPEDVMLALSAAGPGKGGASLPSMGNALKSAKPGFTDARSLGYVIPPGQASEKPGLVNNALSALGGKIKTQQSASVKNQAVTNGIAARELGLPADAMLDESTFDKVRKAANTAYDAVKQAMTRLPGGKVTSDDAYLSDIAKLGEKSDAARAEFPDVVKNPEIEKLQDGLLTQAFSPDAGVDVVKSLRFKSKANLRSWDDPEKRSLGLAQRDAATAIEDLIDRQLAAQGDQGAVENYKAARQLIAKSHDIESVTDASGNVDARKLATLANKRPFTGGLKKIADTAESFPKAMQNPTKFGGEEKTSVLDAGAIVASGTAAIATGNPIYAAGALAPLLRPLSRSIALSSHIQNRLAGLSSPMMTAPRMAAANSLTPLASGQFPPLMRPQVNLPAVPAGNALAPMQPPNQ